MPEVSTAATRPPAETAVPAIETIDLCKTFGTFQAVNHLSLTVQRGEIFGLLGPNGSGKTTTINMISGLSVPTSGEARVMGYDVRHAVRRVRQVLGWIRPEGVYWLTTLLMLALVALFSTGLGVALGAAIQRINPVIGLSINASIYLFFLAGGIGVLAFEPGWLQMIAAYVPLTYGIHALQMALFYSSSDQLGRDALVLSACTLAALALGVLSMRRGIVKL